MIVNVYNKTKQRLYVGTLLNDLREGITPMLMQEDIYYTFPRIEKMNVDVSSHTVYCKCFNGEEYVITVY